MHGYVVSRPVVLRTATQVKHIAASADLDKVDVALVQINALNEHKMVREALSRQFPDVPVDTLVKTVPFEQLAMWSQFPMLLGRGAKGVALVGNVLNEQLRELRARHPQRQRFRILLINGFGTNLGDTLIGLTAFRSVWALLKAHLPEVTVDVLMGWAPLGGVTQLLQQHEGIEQVLHQGPSLQGMARYQGLFDFSALIGLPGYREMAPADWYLWWMGLDPNQVADGGKRNRIAIDPADAAAVAQALSDVTGVKVLINPKASEPLRQMPAAYLQTLTDAVLNSDPDIRVIFDQPVAVHHPRVVHLADVINSPQRLAALVAQVQGIVTTDTFVQHVADATGTPTCTLNTSVPAAFFRYYPMVQTRVLPGAESLGAWGRTKVSREEWATLSPAYAEAWSRLEPAVVLAALTQAQAAKVSTPTFDAARIDNPRPASRPTLVKSKTVTQSILVPRGQRTDQTSEALQRQLLKLAEHIVVPGDTVVLLGAGTGELACALADRVELFGRVIAFEPRRMIHQLLCANVLDAGHAIVETHPVMPTGLGLAVAQLPRMEVQDDHSPLDGSNQPVSEPVIHWPLDRLELPHCRLIVQQSPVPLIAALQGAAATVTRHRPFILAGLLKPEELPVWQHVLRDEDYEVRPYLLKDLDAGFTRDLEQLEDRSLILVAQPRKHAVSRERS